MKTCRVAFVGAGGMIREHARAFRDVPGVEIAGITNRTRSKAETLAVELGIPAAYDTVAEMHAATQADLVVMAVYEPAIRETAEACFAHDWAVLMEKPIGLDAAEARVVAAAAERSGRRVWVGLNRRTLSSTQAVLADLGTYPGQRYIRVQDQQSLETARAIGHTQAVIDNWMFANSIHLVDYLLTFGRGAVTGVERLVHFDPERPGLVVAKVAFDSGDIGIYEGLWHAPGPWACSVTTARRRWELRPLERATFQNAGERSLNPVDLNAFDETYKPGFRLQAERVVAAWRGEASQAATIKDALDATELVARIYQPEG